MSDTVVLGGVEVELTSDVGHAFIVDCVRCAESLLTDKELAAIYEISPADWSNIANDAALGRAIRAERDRRVLNGTAAREAASRHFVKAPTILDRIMSDEGANARHRSTQSEKCAQSRLQKNKIVNRTVGDLLSRSTSARNPTFTTSRSHQPPMMSRPMSSRNYPSGRN